LERKLPGGICTRWKTVPLHGAHDKGRYRQLRRDRNLPNFSSRNRLQNIRNLGSSARMSRVGTEFDPPKKGPLGIVDVNVPLSFTHLYHSLTWVVSPSEQCADYRNQSIREFMSVCCGSDWN